MTTTTSPLRPRRTAVASTVAASGSPSTPVGAGKTRVQQLKLPASPSPRTSPRRAPVLADQPATPVALVSPTWSPHGPAEAFQTPKAFLRSPVAVSRRSSARLSAKRARLSSPLPRASPADPKATLISSLADAQRCAATPVERAFDSFGMPLPTYGHTAERHLSVSWTQWALWYTDWLTSLTSSDNIARLARWRDRLSVNSIKARFSKAARFKPGAYELDGGLLMNNYDGATQEALWIIAQDIPRTYPTHALLLSPTCISDLHLAPHGMANLVEATRKSLYHILASYAAFNQDVGYCQGMSYVVAALLMIMSEEEAFWVLVALLDSPRHLRDFYEPNLSGLLMMGQLYDCLMEQHMADLQAHLTAQGLHHLVYVTPWFMRLFSSYDSWPLFRFVLDEFISEGHIKLLQAALGTMALLKDDLLEAPSINQLLPLLQTHAAAVISPESLGTAMNKIKLTWAEMDDLRQHIIDSETSRKASTTVERKRARDAAGMQTPGKRKHTHPPPLTPSKTSWGSSFLGSLWDTITPTNKPAPTKQTAVKLAYQSPPTSSTDVVSNIALSPTSMQAFREFSTPTARSRSQPPKRTPRKLSSFENHAGQELLSNIP